MAVARKLAELVWHLLTKEEDFLCQVPRLVQEKRSRVRLLAKRRTGRRAAPAESQLAGRPALYGSGLPGRKVKADIARQAAEHSEAIYQAIVEHRGSGQDAADVVQSGGFDPTRPVSADWQRVLEKIAERYVDSLPRSATVANSD